ncbi:hypothetical protein T439DRAFT_321523 [Meredithblackwellia eburnea MCA 4105]
MESAQGLFTAYPQIDRLRLWEKFFVGLIELNGAHLERDVEKFHQDKFADQIVS